MKYWIVLFFIFLSVKCQSFDESEKEILVLLDSWANREAYSTFLGSFKNRGFVLRFKLADDPNLSLIRYGDYAYSSILILAPNVRIFGGKVDVASLVKFVDDGGNIFVAGDSNIGEAIREFANECGVEFDSAGTSVIDHFNYDSKDLGSHTRIVVPRKNLIDNTVLTGNGANHILYEGVGLSIDRKNALLIDIMQGSDTSYSYQPKKAVTDYPNTVGVSTKLIAAMQARNNARVVFSGSIKLLTDDFINSSIENVISKEKYDVSGNHELVVSLGNWLTHDSGMLRVKQVKHHRVGEIDAPWEYTINDDVHYSIDIEEKIDGRWVPYVANDVQMDLIRIDSFIRKSLPHSKSIGGTKNHYATNVKLPDVYGVFKFVVDYRHIGYSYLYSSSEISIRPLKHTQYERFIVAAYPYYASAGSMMIGLILFSAVFLYNKDEGTRKKVD